MYPSGSSGEARAGRAGVRGARAGARAACGIKLQAGKRCRRGERVAYLVDSAVAVGVPRPFGVNIPGGSWVLSMSRSAGRVAAMCVHARARGRVSDEGGRREVRPGASMEKKRETSSPSPAVRWRGVRDCARRARAGYRTSARVLETTIPRASSVSRETSSAACEVRTAITRNSTRPPRALDVTTFFVDELLKACVLGRAVRRDAQRARFSPPSEPKNWG